MNEQAQALARQLRQVIARGGEGYPMQITLDPGKLAILGLILDAAEAPAQGDALAILDSHVVELLELLKYDGRENLVAGVALAGESPERYRARTAEPQHAPTSLAAEARASARLDGETRCLSDEGGPQKPESG